MTTKSYKNISLSWQAEHLDMVDRAAKKAGMSRAAFIRLASLELARTYWDKKDDRPEVDVPVFARKQAE
jgi:uncharacterized protein (DUF1778 family)